MSSSRVGLGAVRLPFASDERLARLVARGDEAAFRHLYERYHQPLYRYCRSLLRHEADAQDALQSAFASAFSALRGGQRDAPVRPWLFRIAHNESVSLLRRRRPEQQLSDLTQPLTVSLEEHVEERERLSQLVSDLRELPDRQRGALVMRELSGLSHEEIALALDTSVNAAKQTIFGARRSLTEFAEGRAMACDEVCRLISDSDGRVLRGRRVRAHLRQCSACSAFAAMIPERRAELRALAPPLPAIAAGGILIRVVGGGSAHAGNGAGLVAAGAGKTLGTAITAKVTAVAVAATVAVGVTAAVKHASPTRHPSRGAHSAPVSRARTVGSSAPAPAGTAAGGHPRSRGSRESSAGSPPERNRRGVATRSAGAARAGAIPRSPRRISASRSHRGIGGGQSRRRGSRAVPPGRGASGAGQGRLAPRNGSRSSAASLPAGGAVRDPGQGSGGGGRAPRASSVTTTHQTRGGSKNPRKSGQLTGGKQTSVSPPGAAGPAHLGSRPR